MTGNAVTILLADDHPLFLSGVWNLIALDPGLKILGGFLDGESALEGIHQHLPAIAIIDQNMPKLDGLTVLRKVTAEQRATRVVLLVASISDGHLYEAVEGGVYGIVLKEAA